MFRASGQRRGLQGSGVIAIAAIHMVLQVSIGGGGAYHLDTVAIVVIDGLYFEYTGGSMFEIRDRLVCAPLVSFWLS